MTPWAQPFEGETINTTGRVIASFFADHGETFNLLSFQTGIHCSPSAGRWVCGGLFSIRRPRKASLVACPASAENANGIFSAPSYVEKVDYVQRRQREGEITRIK